MNRELLQGPSLPSSFGFEKEHELLRSEARRVLAERFDRPALRALYEGKLERGLHGELAALGWISTESSWLANALLLEEAGRVLLPAPIADALLAAHALSAGSLATMPAELEAVISGERLATVAFSYGDAMAEGDRFVLHGEFREVRFPTGLLVAPFRLDDDLVFFCCDVHREGVEVSPDGVVDRTKPTSSVNLRGVRVDASARCNVDASTLLERAWLLLAAETLGAAEAVLSMTRAYAIERQQFDRPIGSFQAVSHPLVNVMIAIEQARSLVVAAAAALDHETRAAAREVACRMAKVAACEALWFAASRGVQLHGGFGFTWECDVHFYFRRALFARGALGSSEEHRQRLATLLLDHGVQ